MDPSSTAPWIEPGEKYALIGLQVNLEGVPSRQITPHLWTLADTPLAIPQHWQDWLGTVQTQEVSDCNLYLLTKRRSETPEVLDGENQTLQRRAWHFYVGLLLASPFSPAHDPVSLIGACTVDGISIRQHQPLDLPVPCEFRPYPAVTQDHIAHAAQLAEQLEAIPLAQIPGGHWRLFRTLGVYIKARAANQIIDRIHQYCRTIDGLILPEPGKSKKQFKSRTELFIGAGHSDLMGDIYDIRSAVEHLHEYRYLEQRDRAVRLDLLQKEATIEYIARSALARVIGERALWNHFSNTPALENFWALPEQDRQKAWGTSIDVKTAVADFDPRYINDGELGL